MPMGVTAGVYDGTEMDVNKYMERVARSMTDFIHMRDMSYDSKLTKRSFARKGQVEAAQAALDGFLAKSDDDLYNEWVNDTTHVKQSFADSVRKNKELEKRYEQMLNQVEALEVPADIAYAKTYALKYLRESMDFDIHEPKPEYYETYTFEVWKSKKVESLAKDLAYYTEKYQEDLQRDNDFNEKIELWSQVVGYDIV